MFWKFFGRNLTIELDWIFFCFGHFLTRAGRPTFNDNSCDFWHYHQKTMWYDWFLSVLKPKRLENHEVLLCNTLDFHMPQLSLDGEPLEVTRYLEKLADFLAIFKLFKSVSQDTNWQKKHARMEPRDDSRDVTTGATGATVVAPKFSDTLTLSQPRGADSAHHHRGRS